MDERSQASEPDPNFETLIETWEYYKDRFALFLGAGASVGARNPSGEYFPTASALRNEIWKRYMCPVADRGTFDPRNLGMMSLEHAAALGEIRVGSAILRQFVADLFQAEKPLWQHAVLPFLQPKAVFTTNYDNLVELGWRAQQARSGLSQCEIVFSDKTMAPYRRVPIFKPHGSVERFKSPIGEGGLVLTQYDYFEMLNWHVEMLRKFMEDFEQRCVIFVGYSFFDMDIASWLYELRKRDRGVHWYAVFPRADNDVREMYSARYGIRQINRRFHDFLAELDEAVDFIPPEWKYGRLDDLRRQGLIQ